MKVKRGRNVNFDRAESKLKESWERARELAESYGQTHILPLLELLLEPKI